MTKIVIIGAGVSGLTSAIELKKNNSSYDITIVAKHLVGDIDPEYTSPFAGADWHSFADDSDVRLQQFDLVGYRRLLDLADTEPAAGIWRNVSYVYTVGEKQKGIEWLKTKTDGFKEIAQQDLLSGTANGYQYDGFVISTPIYLQYLFQQALRAGITINRVHQLTDVQQALHLHSSGAKADIVVNCSGLLSDQLGGYKDSAQRYGVKGQVLHVRNSVKHHFSVDLCDPKYPNELVYVMPRREGGCIIGGCMVKNYESVDEDKELTKRIIDRAIKYAPELVDPSFQGNSTSIDIIRVGVGQRPFRDGGVRVEQDPEHKWLIHNYGAGGGGYQGSYGFSELVVRLVAAAAKPKL